MKLRRVVIVVVLCACMAGLIWMFTGRGAASAVVGNANVAGGAAGILALALAVVLLWPRTTVPRSDVKAATAKQTQESQDSSVIVTSRVVARPEWTVWGLLGNTVIEVLVETRAMHAVVLHGVRPIVLRRPAVWIRNQWCLAALKVRGFDVDLDADPPTVTPRREGSEPSAVDFPFTVTASDPEMFRLVIVSRGRAKFELELSWTCAGRTGYTVINDLGRRPFSHP